MAAIDYNVLFDRLGKIGHLAYVLDGDQAALPAVVTSIINLYDGTTDDDLIGGVQTNQDALILPVTQPPANLTELAQATLVRMVNASVPSITALTPAMTELIRQMRADSQSVDTCTVAASGAALSTNVGDAVLVVSTKRGDGLIQQNIVAEVSRLTVTSDSYTGAAVAGQEPVTAAGAAQTAGTWDYNWPTGSGQFSSGSEITASQDASSTGNLLTNSDFEDWSTDPAPELDSWVLDVGTWGTDAQQSTTVYTGTYSLRINAGATNTALYQQFDDSAGTVTSLTPLNSYAVNFWARKLSGTISAGVLTVELVDDLNAVVNDQQGTANSFTVTLSALSTSWAAFSGVFRVPNVPPAVMRLQFRISTDLAGGNIALDQLAMAPLTAAYPGGYGWVVFSGAEPSVQGDGWDVTATNNRAGELYGATFQTLFDRFFDMRSLNQLLPYSGSPTQADTKITA